MITRMASGLCGQCGVVRRSVPRRLLKVSSGSKWTMTKTRFRHPDRVFTIWSRPWQVTSCVTTASSRKNSLPMHIAEPRYQRTGSAVQVSERREETRPSRELISGRQMMPLLPESRLKSRCFLSLEVCEEVGDPINSIVFEALSLVKSGIEPA